MFRARDHFRFRAFFFLATPFEACDSYAHGAVHEPAMTDNDNVMTRAAANFVYWENLPLTPTHLNHANETKV